MDHVWRQSQRHAHYIQLEGFANALVRTEPLPNGGYLWQFRKVASYADTIEAAKEYVEAGAEYFATFHINPYNPR